MATAGISAKNLSDAEHSVQLRRAVVASTVGSVIESYDFLLYVLIAPLVFAKLYFPSSDPLVGTLQAFGIYAVGFISRPLGAAFFGHYGDRIGRKVTLIATLLITGLATFAVGFVPGYASIGIWGAIILTGIRFIQGIGVGGEWGGATLVAMEWAKTNAHRGFITAWPQWGAPAGLFVANIAVLVFSAISGDQFLDWGWRVPFWISIVMVGIGLWIRLGILETPVFQRILDQRCPDLVKFPSIGAYAGKVRLVVADHFHLAQARGNHGQRIFQALRDVDLLNGHLVHVGVVLDSAYQIENARRRVQHGLRDPLRPQR